MHNLTLPCSIYKRSNCIQNFTLHLKSQRVFVLFVCFVWIDAFPKEGCGYSVRESALIPGTEQTFLLPYAKSILTLWLPRIEPSTWLDTKQTHRPRQIGIQSAPGTFQAFRLFSIHKPSSNSSVPIVWITEPATDSR